MKATANEIEISEDSTSVLMSLPFDEEDGDDIGTRELLESSNNNEESVTDALSTQVMLRSWLSQYLLYNRIIL